MNLNVGNSNSRMKHLFNPLHNKYAFFFSAKNTTMNENVTIVRLIFTIPWNVATTPPPQTEDFTCPQVKPDLCTGLKLDIFVVALF